MVHMLYRHGHHHVDDGAEKHARQKVSDGSHRQCH